MNCVFSTSKKAGRLSAAFTLVEVMVAVAILAIMLAAIYPAFILGFASIKTTREDQRATQIVTQKLEAMHLLTWQELSNCPAQFVDYYNPLGASNNTLGTVYVGTMSTTAVATNLTTESYKSMMHLITVGVTWTNYVNKIPVVHNRKMQTFYAYYGLQNYIWGSSP